MVDSRSDGEVLAAMPPPPAALAAALATHQANFAATVTASSIATALATIGPVASTLRRLFPVVMDWAPCLLVG